MSPWVKKYKLSREEVAKILQDFLDGTGKTLAWDGFTLGMSFEDEYLENLRLRCANLSREFPPWHPNEYCNERGREVIRQYIKELRTVS
jgi:hypothetical protein